MRVIAGTFRSRPLRSLRGMDVRPTADKLRGTLFNILTAGNPDALQGTVWLDLYAGTGAVGIEAISRGASMVYFVESSAEAAELIRSNLASLKVDTGFQVVKQDVGRTLNNLQCAADFVFLDPPYRMEDASRNALASLGNSQIVKAQGVVIAEHEKRFDPGNQFGNLQRFRTLTQGDASLSFFRRQ